MSVIATTAELGHAMHTDYLNMREQAGRVRALLLAGQVAVTAAITAPYLVGGLEATIATVGSNTFEFAQDHHPVVRALEVGAATGVVSLAIELGLTALVGSCMKHFPATAQAFERKRYDNLQEPERARSQRVLDKLRNVFDPIVFAAAAGSPGIMLRSFVRTPDADHTKKGVRTAYTLAGVNFALGAGVIGGGFSAAPEEVVDIAQTPWPWIALFVGPRIPGAIYKAVKNRRRPGRHRKR